MLGLDAQISNWAIKNYDSQQNISEESQLLFIDTSTPFIRSFCLVIPSLKKRLRNITRKINLSGNYF